MLESAIAFNVLRVLPKIIELITFLQNVNLFSLSANYAFKSIATLKVFLFIPATECEGYRVSILEALQQARIPSEIVALIQVYRINKLLVNELLDRSQFTASEADYFVTDAKENLDPHLSLQQKLLHQNWQEKSLSFSPF